MKAIGNIIWFLVIGLISWIAWVFAGIVCYITIVGIPLGTQCFKLASLSAFPFGKNIVYGGSSVSFIANLLWIALFGWELAVAYVITGILFYVTIIGAPFGKQCMKLAKLSLMPFGATII